jgi:hypothetical protein
MTEHRHSTRRSGLLASAIAILSLAAPAAASAASTPVVIRGIPAGNVTVYSSGFYNPRGLKFGPDGMLYVAEGGPGGTASTVGQCTQAAGPPAGPGPYTGSPTGGRISKVNNNGVRTTVIDTFPSSQTSDATGNLVSGVADIAFIGNTMYALTAGAGCSHGVANSVNGIFRVSGGTATLVADLSTWEMAHPIAVPDLEDFEPDGTWYSMVAVRGDLYATEPNQGQIDRITTSGAITRIADTSTIADLQPTALAYHGTFYFGNLGPFPIDVGGEQVRSMTPSGSIHSVVTGLTTVLGLAFDNRGRMYVLESSVNEGLPQPGYGDVVRVIGSGLAVPSAMTYGPDGALYVSNVGFGAPPVGAGEVLRITIPD